MLKQLVPSTVLALLVSEAVLLAAVYVLFAYYLLDIDPLVWLRYENGMLRVGVTVGVILVGMYFQDMYDDLSVRSHFALFQQICLAVGAAFLVQALLSYASPDLVLPKWIMMGGSAALLVLLLAWRSLYASRLMHAIGSERVLFLGASEVGRQVAQRYTERPELNRTVMGFIVEPEDSGKVTEGPVVGGVEQFKQIVDERKPDRVVVGMTGGGSGCRSSTCWTSTSRERRLRTRPLPLSPPLDGFARSSCGLRNSSSRGSWGHGRIF